MSRERINIPAPPSPEDPARTQAVIALGANLGDRGESLRAAADEISRLPLVFDMRMSEPIETVALTLDGFDDSAPPYLNSVAIITTSLAPSVLLSYLQEIERRHGRVRRERWGARTLDLDIVTYGDERSDDPNLTLPHPRAAERAFVLGPWLAVDPDAVLPGHGRVDALLAGLEE